MRVFRVEFEVYDTELNQWYPRDSRNVYISEGGASEAITVASSLIDEEMEGQPVLHRALNVKLLAESDN